MNRIRKLVQRGTSAIIHGDNLEVLKELPDGCAGLIYIDPVGCKYSIDLKLRGLPIIVVQDTTQTFTPSNDAFL